MENEKGQAFKRNLFIIFAFVSFVSIMIPGLYFWQFGGELSKNQSIWAEFGSFVGGTLTPVVSLFAFLALLITIIIQSRTLEVSRTELKLTREEFEKARISAEMQANHFKTEALINDIIASIEKIEDTIDSLKIFSVPVYDVRIKNALPAELIVFLQKDINKIRYWSPSDANLSTSENFNPEEIGRAFKLLFEQILLLKEIPEAKHRYRVIIHKHLETMFLLNKVAALPFDWKAQLDEESREWITLYDEKYSRAVSRVRRVDSQEF